MSRIAIASIAVALALAGCGGTRRAAKHAAAPIQRPAKPPEPPTPPGPPKATEALVTAETENELLMVDLPGDRVVGRAAVPEDPENVASGRVVVVVSSKAGEVTLLAPASLRPLKTFTDFRAPHIPAISPDGERVYVTDDARGTVTVIRLGSLTRTSTVWVGPGAHHMSFSPDQSRLWIALGESATRIAILNTSDPDHPRLLGYLAPGFRAHDLSFSPDGRRVWISSADGPDISVLDARDHRLLFRVPVGPPPQHLEFDGRFVYLTSGYGATIEKVDGATGRVLATARTPYGSFELDTGHGYVVLSSLLRGTVSVYDSQLRLLHTRTLAPATRDVAIAAGYARWPGDSGGSFSWNSP